VDSSAHRDFAIAQYNECWRLLELPARSRDDDAALLGSAFTSRHHWIVVGGAEQLAIADWMVSRAAAAAGYGDLSVDYAARALEESEGLADWLRASAAEGMARACAAAGDAEGLTTWRERARVLVSEIADEEDRAVIAEQLASLD
jgi:peptidyl-tRNA hydrolase